jgi:hypothetical protein
MAKPAIFDKFPQLLVQVLQTWQHWQNFYARAGLANIK